MWEHLSGLVRDAAWLKAYAAGALLAVKDALQVGGGLGVGGRGGGGGGTGWCADTHAVGGATAGRRQHAAGMGLGFSTCMVVRKCTCWSEKRAAGGAAAGRQGCGAGGEQALQQVCGLQCFA